MKLVLLVANRRECQLIGESLGRQGYWVNVLASTGPTGEERSTLMVVCPPVKLDEVLALLQQTCAARTEFVNALPPLMAPGELFAPESQQIPAGTASLMVLDLGQWINV